MAYEDFKILPKRTTKVLHDKVLDIAGNSSFDEHQRALASIVYKCFAKQSSGSRVKSEVMTNH